VITRAELSLLDHAAKDALILAQAETIALLQKQVEALTQQVAVLTKRVTELEARLNLPPKTPDNSSLPPSAGHKASGVSPDKPGGKSKAHPGAHRPLHPNPTRKREVLADNCQHCGADVSGAVQKPILTYDRIEIPKIEPDVTQLTLFGGTCPCCARKFTANAPLGLEPGSPFGPNLRAFVFYLRFTQCVALERLTKLLRDLFGITISEGALVNMFKKSQAEFARQWQAIRTRLLSGTALQSDETSIRVGKKNHWLWTFHHKQDACFVIAPSRAKVVVEDFLDGHRPDFWVSDRYGAQMGWARKDHQICLAHLIRDVQYAIDAGDQAFAPKMRELLEDACGIGRRRPNLADATLRSYACKLEKRLDNLLRITPIVSEGEKLQRAIKQYRQHLFVFVTNREIPATNNGSEQALRPGAVYRKITNGFRSPWAARLYADIRSVVETARRRGIGALDAIRFTLAGVLLPLPP
jgi:transposase